LFSLYSGNAEETSRRCIFSSLKIDGQSRPAPRLVINVDHRIVGIISFVLVNPFAATPLFSPSSLARAALFGLVVYKPRGQKVAKPKICRKAPVIRQCTIVPPCQTGLVNNGKSHLVMDPSDVGRRVVESNLRVVRRGSQWVNLVYVYVYVCM
jgi:hypothetical protein